MGEVSQKFPFGTIVWAKPKGWPPWPGMVVPYNLVLLTSENKLAPPAEVDKLCIEFFGDGRISVVSPNNVILFEKGMRNLKTKGRYAAQVKHAAEVARDWIQHYSKIPGVPSSHIHNADIGIYDEVEQIRNELAEESALLKKEQAEVTALKSMLPKMNLKHLVAHAFAES